MEKRLLFGPLDGVSLSLQIDRRRVPDSLSTGYMLRVYHVHWIQHQTGLVHPLLFEQSVYDCRVQARNPNPPVNSTRVQKYYSKDRFKHVELPLF